MASSGVAVVFWLTAQQAGSSLTVFAATNTVQFVTVLGDPIRLGPGHFGLAALVCWCWPCCPPFDAPWQTAWACNLDGGKRCSGAMWPRRLRTTGDGYRRRAARW